MIHWLVGRALRQLSAKQQQAGQTPAPVSSIYRMRVGAANFADLGGKTNPQGIWSVEYLFFKQAVDRGAPSDEIVDTLERWLATRTASKKGQLHAILKLTPEQALSELVNIIRAGWHVE